MRPSRLLLASACVAVLVTVGTLSPAVPLLGASQQPVAAPLADQIAVDDVLKSAEGLLRQRQGNRALPLFERALEGACRLKLEPQEAQALCAIGEVLHYATRYTTARERALGALEIYERLSAAEGVGRASYLLSMVDEITGNSPSAQTRATQAVAAYESIGHRQGRALATLQLLRVGGLDLPEERPLYGRVIEDARAVGDRGIEGRALHSLGDHLFTASHFEEALDRLNEAAAVVQETGESLRLGSVFNSLGRVYRAHGRLD